MTVYHHPITYSEEAEVLSGIAEVTECFRLADMVDKARSRRGQLERGWERNLAVYNNRVRIEELPSYLPSPLDNRIVPILSAFKSYVLSQNVRFGFIPAAKFSERFFELSRLCSDLTDMVNSLFAQGIWMEEIERALHDALMFGLGWLKVYWDNSAHDGKGDVGLAWVPAWNVWGDPNSYSLDSLSYLCHLYQLSVSELRDRFPEAMRRWEERRLEEATVAPKPPAGTEGGGTDTPFTGLYQQGNQLLPTLWPTPTQQEKGGPRGMVDNDMVQLWEVWERAWDKERQATGWRYTIFSGDTIFARGWAVDAFGLDILPYVRVVIEETGDLYPVPLVSLLAPLQIQIIRLKAFMQHNIELTAMPKFIAPKIPNEDFSVTPTPGGEIRVPLSMLDRAAALKPDWLAPPQISADVPRLIQECKQAMDEIAGVTGISQLLGSQQNLTALAEAASVRIRTALKHVEFALARIGYLVGHMIIRGYSAEHVTAALGERGLTTLAVFADAIKDPWAFRFMVQAVAGANDAAARQQRIAEADTLYAMGVVDEEFVLEAHGVPNAGEVLRRTQLKKQLAAAQAANAPQPARRVPRSRLNRGPSA